MRFRSIIALLLAAILPVFVRHPPAQARQSAEPYPITNIGGAIRAVAVQGSYVYIGEGSKLSVILGPSQSASPHKVGSAALNGTVVAIKVVDSQAYVLTTQNGQTLLANNRLYIVDVSDPGSPRIVSSTKLKEAGSGLDVANGRAYVGMSNCCGGMTAPGRLQIFDVTVPASPTLSAEFVSANVVPAVQVAGQRAYIIHNSDVSILDVSVNPPAVIGTYNTYAPRDLAVSGDYAFVTDDRDGLVVLNISQPAAISLVRKLPLPGGQGALAVSNGIAYITRQSYGDQPGGMYKVKVSNPADPLFWGTVGDANSAFDVAVTPSAVYLANGESGLRSFSIEPDQQLAEKNRYLMTGTVIDVYAAGDMAYVVDASSTFRSFDLRGPEPERMRSLPLGGYDLMVISNTAFLLSEQGLHLIDVSHPAVPAVLSTYALPHRAPYVPPPHSFDIQGSFAYISTPGEQGITVVDISDPLSPTLRAQYANSNNFYNANIDVVGDRAYLAQGHQGITILDLHNLDAIRESGHYTSTYGDGKYPVHYRSFATRGNLMYVSSSADGKDTLSVLDVSDPASVRLLNSYETTGQINDLAIDNGAVYMSGADIRIATLDDPTSPTPHSSVSTANTPDGLQIHGRRLYVNEASNGFSIVTLPAVAPTVSTDAASGVTAGSAILGGVVSADGGAAVSERGVVYAPAAISAAPALGQAGVLSQTMGLGNGPFSATVAGLRPATAYAARAYARNAAGVSYGPAITFTTAPRRIFLPLLRR